MEELMKKAQANISATRVPPLYADEVFVAHVIKANKDSKGKTSKEGHFVLIFIDITNQQPIAKIVLSPSTAKNLKNAIEKDIQSFESEIKSKKIKNKIKKQQSNIGYIG